MDRATRICGSEKPQKELPGCYETFSHVPCSVAKAVDDEERSTHLDQDPIDVK